VVSHAAGPQVTGATSKQVVRHRYLDCLRAAAVLMVLVHHGPHDAGSSPAYLALRRAGWSGVDLFFVLSGFLVAGLLFREYSRFGDIDLARFFVRRGLKIYPSFYACLATYCAVQLLAGRRIEGVRVAVEALFVQNFFWYRGLFFHTWSLAVEEHFYLALGVFALYQVRRRRAGPPFARMPQTYAVVALAALGFRVAVVAYADAVQRPFDEALQQLTHFWTNARMDSLFLGVLLAYARHFHGEALAAFVAGHRRWLSACAVVGLLPAFVWEDEHVFIQTLGFTMLAFAYAAILLLVLHAQPPRPGSILERVVAHVARVGEHSYGIYLWHIPFAFAVPYCARAWLGEDLPYEAWAATYFVGSVLVGVVATRLVEVPFLALRDRRFPPRS
jgi:peptidoglycan/LPS O-acetylase OafA/YrhL